MNSQFFRRVDRDTWIALFCLTAGWFFLATVVTTLGPVKQKYHFFDMLTVMLNPAWLLYGMGSSHPLESVVFGLLDIGVLVLPLVPYQVKTRSAWLLSVAPLVLMLLCGVELYEKTAGPYFEATQRAGSWAQAAVRFGNHVAEGVGDAAARHISIGLGGYVALAASLFLAIKGLRVFRAAADPTAGLTSASVATVGALANTTPPPTPPSVPNPGPPA
jgi:hypothetical protein